MKSIIKKSPILIVIILYTISNFILLINNGMYWDDWCLLTSEGVSKMLTDSGTSYMIPIHLFLKKSIVFYPLIYHILVFVFEIIGILIFYQILKKINYEKLEILILTILFAIIPYNISKIYICTFSYSLGLFIFNIGLFFFINVKNLNNIFYRIFVIICFFISFFFLPSLLVFYLGIILFLILRISFNSKLKYFESEKIARYLDFILIPFIFWIIRSIFYKPSGIYSEIGYREIQTKTFITLPLTILQVFYENVVGLLKILPSNFDILFISLFVLIFFLINRIFKFNFSKKTFPSLFFGIFLFLIAVTPYLLLNLKPSWLYENTRHQILIKYSAPFIILYCVNKINNINNKLIIITIIISSSIFYNLNNLLRFQKSWIKQEAIELELRLNKNIKWGDNFIMIDEAKEYNEYQNGTYSLYCYTGIASKSFNNQSHLIIDKENYSNLNKEKIIESRLFDQIKYYYNIKDIKSLNKIDYSFIIKKGNTPLTYFKTIQFTYYYFFNKDLFYKNLPKIVLLEYNKCINF